MPGDQCAAHLQFNLVFGLNSLGLGTALFLQFMWINERSGVTMDFCGFSEIREGAHNFAVSEFS